MHTQTITKFERTKIQKHFHSLTKEAFQFIQTHLSQKDILKVKTYFNEYIAPLYGPQDAAINKIFNKTDRVCKIFRNKKSKEDLGIVVYKLPTRPSSNPEEGLLLEIKTLFVIDPEKNSGKKIASYLLYDIASFAAHEHVSTITITVSSARPESLGFFLHYGFTIKNVEKDCYVNGFDEFFLVHNDPNSLLQELITTISHKDHPHLKFSLGGFLTKLLSSVRKSPLKAKVESVVMSSELLQRELIYNEILILSQEPLLLKETQIGSLLIAVDNFGNRAVIGAFPKLEFPKEFWNFFLNSVSNFINIRNVRIASVYDQALSTCLSDRFPEIRIFAPKYLKTWAIERIGQQKTSKALLNLLNRLSQIIPFICANALSQPEKLMATR